MMALDWLNSSQNTLDIINDDTPVGAGSPRPPPIMNLKN